MVTAALAEYASGRDLAPVLVALGRARLLIPVVVAPGSERGKVSMATPLSLSPDGRRALLAFSGLPSLVRWRAGARPVPQPVADVARAALAEGAAAVVVDIAGPVPVPIEGDDLAHLAAGLRLVSTPSGHAWTHPAGLIP